jgi:serine/threonine protein kinase
MGGGSSRGFPLRQQRDYEHIYRDTRPQSHDLISKISIGPYLGKGGYSTVFYGKNKKTKLDIAVKRIKIKKQSAASAVIDGDGDGGAGGIETSTEEEHRIQAIFQELNAMKRIESHRFIINLHSAFHYKSSCYLVLDCLTGGDLRLLFHGNGPIHEDSVVYLIACIGSALSHIHSHGVIHRDIKPENILMDSYGRPFLTDFGISFISSPENPIPVCQDRSGTLCYMAPEVLGHGSYHSYQSDYWSLGVMAYELLYGSRPFYHHCSSEIIQFVSKQYEWLWKQLKEEYQHEDVHLPSPVVNFQDLRPPVDWVPSSSSPNLNEDGTVPSALLVDIPSYRCASFYDPTSDNVIFSEECQSLLRGLLDIRFTHRLGNRTHSSEFYEHPCFVQYNYDHLHLSSIPSPILMRNYATPAYTKDHRLYPLSTRMDSSDNGNESNSALSLSSHLQSKLSEFHYLNPHIGQPDTVSFGQKTFEKISSRVTSLTNHYGSRRLSSSRILSSPRLVVSSAMR